LADYYAQPADLVVGRRTSSSSSSSQVEEDIDSKLFSSLLGEWHWKRVFQKIYDEREGHWLTPVELFRPHYSHILGNFCAHHATIPSSSTATGFEIVELGCGRGTNANLILSYLQDKKPEAYEKLTSYTLVDSSPSLHTMQKKAFQGSPHADKVRFELVDLVDVAEGRCVFLLCVILRGFIYR
jgi:hypothetical protein